MIESKKTIILKEFALNHRYQSVLHQIRCKKITSKSDLAQTTHIKQGTLTLILNDLLSEELIIEVGQGESTGGRRPILYSINPKFGYILGLDISRTYAKLVLSDFQMELIDSYHWPVNQSTTPPTLFKKVEEACNELMRKHNIDQASLIGLGIGTIGPLDNKNRIMLKAYDFPAPGWDNVDICTIFEEKLGVPVLLDNGACTALRAEYWNDDPCYYHNLVYINLGIGFRSAIMSNGVINSGAIGQMIIQTDGIEPHNPYGNYGALHSYVIISYILNKVKSRLKQGRKSILNKLTKNFNKIDFPLVVHALDKNDPLVVEVFTQSATYFGIGLANIINILHPTKIILGGPLISESSLFYKIATEIAQEKIYYYPFYEVRFSKSQLGENGIALGAAIMVIDSLINSESVRKN